ncbi:MAG: thioredoxin-like domain-containing protein [Bacteroidota bacterium]
MKSTLPPNTLRITLFSLCFLGTLHTFCQEEELHLTAELTGFPDSTLFFLENTSTQAVLDTAMLISGKFEMYAQLAETPETLFLYARLEGEKPKTWLLLGNEAVTLKADKKDFPWQVDATGSASQDEREAMRNYILKWQLEGDRLQDKMMEQLRKSGNIKMRLAKKWSHAGDSVKARKWAYLQTHPNEVNSLYQAKYLLNKFPKQEIQGFYNSLTPEMKANKFAAPIRIFLEEGFVQTGDTLYDFVAEDMTGKSYRFSEVTGDYTLLTFMSTQCGVSRASNEGLKKLVEAQDSIKVVSFSVDANREIWANSCKTEGGDWLSLWDGTGAYGKTYIRYGQPSFPGYVLIGPDKKVIAQWSGYSTQGDSEYIIKKIQSALK